MTWRLAWIAACVVAGGVLVALDWPATLTDEDDYMPYALADIASGRNPYAAQHEGSGTIVRPWNEQAYEWQTSYPYLPALALLQIPGLDYRWTALLAYGALLLALRSRAWGFWAFANPLGVWFAASGFNDFVPLALLAWSTRLPWLAWIAAASKQSILPLLAVEAILTRSWRKLAASGAFTVLVCVPFVLWDPRAFVEGVFLVHANKASDAWNYWNYWLYPVYAVAVLAPARKGYGVTAREPNQA